MQIERDWFETSWVVSQVLYRCAESGAAREDLLDPRDVVCCASLWNAFSSHCSFYDRRPDYSVTTAGVEIALQALGDIVLDVGGNSGQDIELLTSDSLRDQRIAQDRYTAQMLRLDSF